MIPPRYFNTLTILPGGMIRKSSREIDKIIAEYRWFKTNNTFNHPKVSNLVVSRGDARYDMEYIEGKTLAEHFIDEDLPLKVFADIFQYIAQKLKMCRLQADISVADMPKHIEELSRMYTAKTMRRITNSSWAHILDESYVLNGVQCPTVCEIISACPVPVEAMDVCSIHGDLCFSNIILKEGYTEDCDLDEYLYFVDPRGLSPDGEVSSIGDYKYDVGKLGHSVLGLYDLIKADLLVAERRDDEYTLDTSMFYYKECISELFFDIFGREEAWYNIMIHLFLSMIPLHADRPEHQHTMLATALKLYLEKKSIW